MMHLVAAILALSCGTAFAAGKYRAVTYPPSQRPGELQIEVTYALWLPDDVKHVRAVILHQHGCGFGANAAGETAAHDLHWQALAAKWDAVLGPSPFEWLTLEPNLVSEKFDLLWKDATGTHAVQVKSSINPFTNGALDRLTREIKSWAAVEIPKAKCRLVLVGQVASDALRIRELNGVTIDPRGPNEDVMFEQAAHRLHLFVDREFPEHPVRPWFLELIVGDLTAKLESAATRQQQIDRASLVATLKGWITQSPQYTAAIAYDAGLTSYRRHLAQTFGALAEGSLRFLGGSGGIGTKPQPPRLAEIYVGLDATLQPGETIGATTQPIEWDENSNDTSPAVRLVVDHPRLVLVGVPGAGKSTFIKHVCLCLAQHSLEPGAGWLRRLSPDLPDSREEPGNLDRVAQLADLVPVFIDLRRFADELAADPPRTETADSGRLWKYLRERLDAAGCAEAKAAVERAVKTGSALVCFDGLDEVPTDALKIFLRNTISEFAAQAGEGVRVVVTCRSVAYLDEAWRLPGFEQASFEPLDEISRDLFVQKLYVELETRGRIAKGAATLRTASLTKAVGERDELREMAGNPYLLSIMTQLHVRTELPAKRASLFEKFVTELLFDLEVEKRRDDSALPTPGLAALLRDAECGEGRFRGVLSRLAFLAHKAAQTLKPGKLPLGGSVYILERDLREALAKLPHRRFSQAWREDWATKILRLVEQRAGLVEVQAHGRYSMAFKLQEFMAAAHLTNADQLTETHGERATFETAAAELIGDDSGYWEEVVKLAAGIQSHVSPNGQPAARSLAHCLCRMPAPSDAVHIRRASLAGDILRDIGLNDVQSTPSGSDCLDQVRKTLRKLVAKRRLPASERAMAAAALGWLEVLPAGAGIRSDGNCCRPDFAWCGSSATHTPKISDGGRGNAFPAQKQFIMGEFAAPASPEFDWNYERVWSRFDRAWGSFNRFACTRLDRSFYISKYPVTVAQYAAFVNEAKGYEREEFWKVNGEWITSDERIPFSGPKDFEAIFQTPNHPRVGVSWYEARAFCAWLDSEEIRPRLLADSGLPKQARIRLPTEAEWEFVARWTKRNCSTDDRLYPWGNDDDIAVRCNCAKAGIGHTSAVGMFPRGDAECGVADMAGNVWEWCQTKWIRSDDSVALARYDSGSFDSDEGNQFRVLRGGSWLVASPAFVRVAFRNVDEPRDRSNSIGFRVACVLPQSNRKKRSPPPLMDRNPVFEPAPVPEVWLEMEDGCTTARGVVRGDEEVNW